MAELVVVVIGPPGAGKGEQCELLAKRLGAIHLSSGQLLRQAHDAKADQELLKGQFVDLQSFTKIVEPRIEQIPAVKPLILDGFIRLPGSELWLERLLARMGRRIDYHLLIEIDQPEAMRRSLARGRSDDTTDALAQRWRDYESVTVPVINSLREQGLLTVIDGHGTVEQVEQRIMDALS